MESGFTPRDSKMSIGKSIIEMFQEIDASDFPDFRIYKKPLDRSLWVLWVSKEKLGIKKLTAEQIASIIRDVEEISIDAKSITNSFNRAGDKIHTYRTDKEMCFEIMKPGKDYLLSQIKEGSVQVFYFEPERRYTSKRILSKNILGSFTGSEIRIVDPYCGQRCLDILGEIKDTNIKFLTKIEKLGEKEKGQFLRELKDWKSENPRVEFRNYPNTDIHDRYIIATNSIVILGHSIKDLGAKESFAIMLKKDNCKDIFESLAQNFDRRWEQSSPL
jgi:hypothetical protein